MSLGGILAPLNSTMLAVALPELRRDFSVGHAEIGWLVSAYLIAMAVAQPLGGRLGDQLGRARMFRTGLIAFLLFSVGAAFSPTFPVLVLLRTGQALFGAAAIPNGMAMLRESVPASRLGQSSGFTGAAISISAAAGPLLGAGLLEVGSWRLLFLMNIPLVLLALGAQALLAYPTPSLPKRLQLDWAGALAFAALLVALTFVLDSLHGSNGALALGAGVASMFVLAVLFLQRQRTSASPVAEWRLFRNYSYAAATGYVLLSNLVMYTTLLAIPFFLEEVQGHGHRTTGTVLGAMSLLGAAVAPIGGRFSDAVGRRLPAAVGSVIILGAIVAVAAGIDRHVSSWYLATCLAFVGLGMGLSFGAASTAALEAAPRELAGAAAGTNSMMRYLGSIVGAGILGGVLNRDSGVPDIGLFRFIFLVLVAMAALASVTTLFIHRYASDAQPAPAGGRETPVAIAPEAAPPA